MDENNEKFELVEQIYKDAEMGSYTTTKLIEKLREKDNKIKGYLDEILEKYNDFSEKAKDILESNDMDLPEQGFMAKMMSSMGNSKEVMTDNSDSSMADMLIQGISMGSIEMEKKVKAYKDKVDKTSLNLAKEFLHFQQKTIEELKKYL